jgi:hypothetical protein
MGETTEVEDLRKLLGKWIEAASIVDGRINHVGQYITNLHDRIDLFAAKAAMLNLVKPTQDLINKWAKPAKGKP